MRSLKNLRKKREKRRQQIIKDFGYEDLRIMDDDELLEVVKLVKWLEKNYIKGAGLCWMNCSKNYLKRRNVAIGFIKTLPYVESIEFTERENLTDEEKRWPETITVAFIKPDVEKSNK